MGSTNFLQFNPTQANQENDAAYLTDATRTGGAAVDGIWPSNSANKTLYQASTAIAALMQMMANKNFTVSDASLSTLTSVLANILTTADIPGGLQSVTWASSIALNGGAYSGFQIPLQGNTTLSISGQVAGEVIVLLFVQDSTGGRTVTFPGNIIGAVQPDPAAGHVSAQAFKVNSALNLIPIGSMDQSGYGRFNTPPGTENSTAAATTAWAQLGLLMSAGANGYLTLPEFLGGFVLQWGQAAWGGYNTPIPVSFNGAGFPNNCFIVMVTPIQVNGQHTMLPSIVQGSVTTAGFEWQTGGNSATDGQCPVFWFAIGN